MTCTTLEQSKMNGSTRSFCMFKTTKRGFMILELSKRLKSEKLLFEQTKVENFYGHVNVKKKSFVIEIIFLIHVFLCTVLVLYGITITTSNVIEKEINETRRELFYELGDYGLCLANV